MLPNKLAWIFLWIYTVACAVDGTVNPSNWIVFNDPAEDYVPAKVTGKIGEDLQIECKIPNYELKFFAWKLCVSECRSPTAEWKMVVKVDHRKIEILNPTKFDMAPDGSLILKNIQPQNDHNWARCFNKERFVGQDHRSTIIFVAQEPVIISDDPKEYVVMLNMPFVMFCEVKEGHPPPWVAWIWNGHVLQNKTTYNGPTYLLRRRATAEEAGNYTCKAGNMAGNTSFDYQLIVRVESPTVQFKATSQVPRESKGPAETHSTVTSPTPATNAKSSAPSGDNLNTDGSHTCSCTICKAMLGVTSGLLGAVLLFFNKNKVWGWIKLCFIKLCFPITSQNGGDSHELSTAQNIKGHDAREIEDTDSFDWDGATEEL